MSLTAAALLGLGMGVKHTLEADHLAAVCTFVAGSDADHSGLRRAARAGACWAAGHAVTLALASGALVLAGVTMPETLAIVFELAVALVLVGLGVMSLAQARQRAVTREADCSEPPHRVAELSPRRSFAVGLVHGASGTAALTLLVATTLSDPLDALGYILTFSASSVVAMPLAAATLFWLARATLGSAPGRLVIFQRLAGVVSIVAGALIALAALPFSGMS